MKNFIKFIFLISVIFSVLFSVSCGLSQAQKGFLSMDTYVNLTVVGKDRSKFEGILSEIEKICNDVENQISKTIDSSDIYKLNNRGTGADIDISDDTIDVLKTAKYIKELTGGAFEPALGEIIDLWGINEGNDKLPQKADFYPALERNKDYSISIDEINGKEIIIAENGEKLYFDLGGIGKGYALDRINKYLRKGQLSGLLVSFSSSILAAGKTKKDELWTIGVKNPLNPEKLCGVIGATNKVISVSGGYERYIEIDGIRYCHIIDPVTGYPVDNDLLCVVVIMESKGENNGAISDALSTALYVMGKQGALDFYIKNIIDFEMILFVKEDTEKGFDVISTNVIFSEINNK